MNKRIQACSMVMLTGCSKGKAGKLYVSTLLMTTATLLHTCQLISVYVNTRLLACGDLIVAVDQLISNLLSWIGNLILVAKSITLKFF